MGYGGSDCPFCAGPLTGRLPPFPLLHISYCSSTSSPPASRRHRHVVLIKYLRARVSTKALAFPRSAAAGNRQHHNLGLSFSVHHSLHTLHTTHYTTLHCTGLLLLLLLLASRTYIHIQLLPTHLPPNISIIAANHRSSVSVRDSLLSFNFFNETGHKKLKNASAESLLDSRDSSAVVAKLAKPIPSNEGSNFIAITNPRHPNSNKMHQTSSRLLRMTEDDRPFTRVSLACKHVFGSSRLRLAANTRLFGNRILRICSLHLWSACRWLHIGFDSRTTCSRSHPRRPSTI